MSAIREPGRKAGLSLGTIRPFRSLVDLCIRRIVKNKLGDLGALKRIGLP